MWLADRNLALGQAGKFKCRIPTSAGTYRNWACVTQIGGLTVFESKGQMENPPVQNVMLVPYVWWNSVGVWHTGGLGLYCPHSGHQSSLCTPLYVGATRLWLGRMTRWRPYIPKGHCSEGPLVRRAISPNVNVLVFLLSLTLYHMGWHFSNTLLPPQFLRSKTVVVFSVYGCLHKSYLLHF